MTPPSLAGVPATESRYGTRGRLVGSLVALTCLFVLDGLTALSAAGFVLTSDLCSTGDTGLICTPTGQSLVVLLPCAAAAISAALGIAGVATGRALRTPLLVTGYAVTVLGFLAGLLIAVTGPLNG